MGASSRTLPATVRALRAVAGWGGGETGGEMNVAGTRSEYADLPVAQIGAGQLLIRTRYASLNYKDALAVTGRGKVVRRLPLVLGCDGMGEVLESSDSRYVVGDRVVATGFGLSEDHDGGFAQVMRIPGDWAVAVPDSLSDWESMVLGTAGITVALAIHRLEQNGVAPDHGPVAVTGATGGCGSVAVAMLAGLGYEVTAFTGKAGEHGYLRELGATEVRDRPPVAEQTRPLEKAQWAAAIDTVGGPVLAWLTRTMAPHGAIATFGNAGGIELNTTVLPFILRNVSLLGICTGSFPNGLRRQLWQRLGTDLRPPTLDRIGSTIAFGDLPSYARRMLAGDVRGRLVVDVT